MDDRVKCLNPWDCQSKRQYSVDGVYRTLDAGNSAGGQAHGVCYMTQTDVKCLNPWDVQCKHIVTPDGVSESLCAGEKRWGSLPPNVCYEVQMDEKLIILNDQGGGSDGYQQ